MERTSRLVLLAKMEDATAASALAGFSTKLNSFAQPLRQSFTYDQGKEMSRHAELTAVTPETPSTDHRIAHDDWSAAFKCATNRSA
ncbi:protein of unknown function (plasmid) [Caballeronia sp. S22]